MKLMASLSFFCVLLAAESSALLLEASSLHPWGHQEELADANAREMAAWMPSSQKRPHHNAEVRQLEHNLAHSMIGAAWTHPRPRSHRVTVASHSRGHRAGPSAANEDDLAKWLAESRGSHPRRPRLGHPSAEKKNIQTEPLLAKDIAEEVLQPKTGAPTQPIAQAPSRAPASSQGTFAGKAFKVLRGVNGTNTSVDFAKRNVAEEAELRMFESFTLPVMEALLGAVDNIVSDKRASMDPSLEAAEEKKAQPKPLLAKKINEAALKPIVGAPKQPDGRSSQGAFAGKAFKTLYGANGTNMSSDFAKTSAEEHELTTFESFTLPVMEELLGAMDKIVSDKRALMDTTSLEAAQKVPLPAGVPVSAPSLSASSAPWRNSAGTLEKIVADARTLTDSSFKTAKNVPKPGALPASTVAVPPSSAAWRSAPNAMEKILNDASALTAEMEAHSKTAGHSSAHAKVISASPDLAAPPALGSNAADHTQRIFNGTNVVKSKLVASNSGLANTVLPAEAPPLLVPPVHAQEEKNTSIVDAKSEHSKQVSKSSSSNTLPLAKAPPSLVQPVYADEETNTSIVKAKSEPSKQARK